MLRIIGKMFSSSQAQPAFKDETESIEQQDHQEESANQFDAANSSGDVHTEVHNHDLQNGADEADMEAQHTTKANKGKEKAIGKPKRGKASGKVRVKKTTAQKSQIQEELLEDLGEEEHEDFEAGNANRDKEVNASNGVVSSINSKKNSKRNKRPEDNEAPATIRRSTRKTTPANEDVGSESEHPISKRRSTRKTTPTPEVVHSVVTSESEYEAPSPRRTRAGSALGSVEPAAEEPASQPVAPKPIRTRKPNGIAKKNTATLPENTEDHAAEDEDENDVSMEDLIKHSRLGKKASSTQEPPKSRAKKIVRSAVTVEESEVDQPETLETLPKKVEKAKRKTKKSTKPILDELADEDDESIAPLLQPLTPAPVQNSMSSVLEDGIDVDAQLQDDAWSLAPNAAMASLLPDSEIEIHNTPKRPSKKALGKRIATETAPQSRKRQRKSKGIFTGTPPLTDFGFTSHSDGPEAQQQPPPKHHSNEDNEDLRNVATRLVKETLGAGSAGEQEPQTSQVTSSARRPTPAFTPINKGMALQASQTPVLTPSRISIVLPARRASDVARTIPPAEVETIDGLESGSESEYEPLAPELPRPSEKKERRLPTGESQSSNPSTKTPKKQAVSASPKQRTVSRALKAETTSVQRRTTAKSTKGSRFSAQERVELVEHVEAWRSGTDISEYDLKEKIQAPLSKETKPLVDYVYGQMPQYTREKIIITIRRNYHNFEARAVWNAEQDAELAKLCESYLGKWKYIGQQLGRFPEDCRDRYRNYIICGDKQTKAAWSKQEEDNLMGTVAEILESIRELKQSSVDPSERAKDDEALIDWKIVSQRMDHTRSRLQCLQKYKRLKDRFVTVVNDPVATAPVAESKWRLDEANNNAHLMTAKKKLRLLYAIRDSGAGSEGKIPWLLIQQDETKAQNERLSFRLCFRRLREQVPGEAEMEFQEIVETLIDAFETAAPNEPDGYSMNFTNKRAREETGEPSSSKKRKSSARKILFLEDESDDAADNGEGPSAKRLSITKAKKPSLIRTASPRKKSSFTTQPPTSTKKTKLHERMRQQDQSGSQETRATNQDRGSREDILSTMQSMKTGTGKPKAKRIAKKPLNKAKTTQPRKSLPKPISAERITASDDEMDRNPEDENAPAVMDDTIHTMQARPAIEAEPEDEEVPEDEMELEQRSLHGPDFESEDLDQHDQYGARDTESAPAFDRVDSEPEDGDVDLAASESEVAYANLPQDLDEINDDDGLPATSPAPVGKDSRLTGGGSGGPESDEVEPFPNHTEPDHEDPYSLPAHPRQQSDNSSSENPGMDDSDEDNEITMMTHDQESVDLDNTQAEAADDNEFDMTDDDDVEPEAEPAVNGINGYREESEELSEDLPHVEPEQQGFQPGTQGPPSRWDGYGDALQYNRDQSRDNERISLPPRQPYVEQYPPPSSSSDASTIYQRPRFVVSAAPKAFDDSDITSSSDEDFESEAPVEQYADDDKDNNYEEAAPRRRSNNNNRRNSGRRESVEL